MVDNIYPGLAFHRRCIVDFPGCRFHDWNEAHERDQEKEISNFSFHRAIDDCRRPAFNGRRIFWKDSGEDFKNNLLWCLF